MLSRLSHEGSARDTLAGQADLPCDLGTWPGGLAGDGWSWVSQRPLGWACAGVMRHWVLGHVCLSR